MRSFSSFAKFYPFYLGEHRHRGTRRLHFLGSSLALFCFLAFLLTGGLWWLAGAVVAGYGFAWAGHLFVERNRPATFRQPVYSFISDWLMFWQILTGKLPF